MKFIYSYLLALFFSLAGCSKHYTKGTFGYDLNILKSVKDLKPIVFSFLGMVSTFTQ